MRRDPTTEPHDAEALAAARGWYDPDGEYGTSDEYLRKGLVYQQTRLRLAFRDLGTAVVEGIGSHLPYVVAWMVVGLALLTSITIWDWPR